MIVKRKLVRWNKKVIAAIVTSICAYYSSVFILIILVPSISSPLAITFLIFLSFLLFLLFLFMPLEVKTEVEEVVEAKKIFEVNVDREIESLVGASIGKSKVQESIIIAEEGIVRYGYLIEWEKFKSCEIKSNRIILHAKFGYPSIILPYNEEILFFIKSRVDR